MYVRQAVIFLPCTINMKSVFFLEIGFFKQIIQGELMRKSRIILFGTGLLFLTLVLFPTFSSAMNLTILLPGGQSIQVTADDGTSIEGLKEKVFRVTEINPTNQIMFMGGKKLEDSQTLSSYRIKDGDSLRVELGVIASKTKKTDSGMLWVFIGFVIIVGTGVFFMRRKPTDDTSR